MTIIYRSLTVKQLLFLFIVKVKYNLLQSLSVRLKELNQSSLKISSLIVSTSNTDFLNLDENRIYA